MKLEDEVIDLRIKGNTYNQICKILNISKATVSYHCKKYKLNGSINGNIVLSDIDISNINLYYVNHTIKETAEKFNISRTTVIKYVDNKRKLLTDVEIKNRNYLRVKNRRNKLKEMAVEYLGGKCIKCNYDKCIWALEFHHKNSNEKEFTISRYSNLSWNKLKIELDKCELVCSNCHKEIHYREHWDVSPLPDKQ